MFKFLLIILLFIISIFLILGVFLGKVIRSFGSTNRKREQRNTGNDYASDSSQKKFSKDEGEYVNYEEVKDDE